MAREQRRPRDKIIQMQVTALHVYPIKATAVTSLLEATVEPRGLAGDRRWMLVDEEGQCLHQRIHPQLATVKAEIVPNGLRVRAAGRAALPVEQPTGNSRLKAVVWADTVDAADAGEEAASWFSEFMGFACRLAFMDDQARRPVSEKYSQQNDLVSFADAMPLLLSTEASLADLNRRLSDPVPMSRFRPNLVLDGDTPWAEDNWHRLQIGEVVFRATHRCVRCVVTTVDQATGNKQGSEPLKTLATFRNFEQGVCFGQNLLPESVGQIRVGDPVQLL